MSDRLDYCKKLMKRVLIIHANLGTNEGEELSTYIDELEEKQDKDGFLVDDAIQCRCENRSDEVKLNNKKYCVDCLRYFQDTGKPENEIQDTSDVFNPGNGATT